MRVGKEQGRSKGQKDEIKWEKRRNEEDGGKITENGRGEGRHIKWESLVRAMVTRQLGWNSRWSVRGTNDGAAKYTLGLHAFQVLDVDRPRRD